MMRTHKRVLVRTYIQFIFIFTFIISTTKYVQLYVQCAYLAIRQSVEVSRPVQVHEFI